MNTALYSIKMRASQTRGNASHHISGAERIVPEADLTRVCGQLLQRALKHSKGRPDNINLKIETVPPGDLTEIPALPVSTVQAKTAEDGLQIMAGLMQRAGVPNPAAVMAKLAETWGMRGGMLLDVDSLQRLEPDLERGIRVTYMDMAAGAAENRDIGCKNHFQEALVLASKAAHHPNIVGELCISDDPDYVTGYFASAKTGYVRITKLKEPGCPDGGRIFLFKGSHDDAADCIRYLQQQRVLVKLKDDYTL